MPDTKPGVELDAMGRCNACRSASLKNTIDWESREYELVQILSDVKQQNQSTYDCLVPVSGGKDSWFQALVLSKKYGMKTLCVTLASHLPTTEGIQNLNNMIKDLNVDHMKITLKQSVYRELRKKCFLTRAEPNWAEHAAVFASVTNIAILYGVPLIVWGEDIAFEFGGKASDRAPADATGIDKSDLNAGVKLNSWFDQKITPRDMYFYTYPDYKLLKQNNIKSIYLGHFLRWYGRKNYEAVKERGFVSRRQGPLSGNYIDYDNIDEKLCEVNIWLKYIKFGFWRATDQCCYDIWNNRISRDEAIEIVNKLSDEFPSEYFQDFLTFHKITPVEFWETVEKFRNREIWQMMDGNWELKNKIKSTAI
jgi:N-acetyl sugar amidotransferase